MQTLYQELSDSRATSSSNRVSSPKLPIFTIQNNWKSFQIILIILQYKQNVATFRIRDNLPVKTPQLLITTLPTCEIIIQPLTMSWSMNLCNNQVWYTFTNQIHRTNNLWSRTLKKLSKQYQVTWFHDLSRMTIRWLQLTHYRYMVFSIRSSLVTLTPPVDKRNLGKQAQDLLQGLNSTMKA